MSVKDGKHQYMSVELIGEILHVIKLQPDYLDDFERSLLNDRLDAIQKYGNKAATTRKQTNALLSIVVKVRLMESARMLRPLTMEPLK